MREKICMSILFLAAAVMTVQSCRHRDLIPQDVMSRIYYDMYMTDQAVKDNRTFDRMTDTLRIYEPLFNRYGYTTDDYIRSVNTYLERPDRFIKVFEETKAMLEKREAVLKKIVEIEMKTPKSWPLIDSLEIITAEGIHSGRFYKNLRMIYFTPDSCVPSSPRADSAFMLRPQNPFMIFDDSALNADSRFAFYLTRGFMHELTDTTASAPAPETSENPAAESTGDQIQKVNLD